MLFRNFISTLWQSMVPKIASVLVIVFIAFYSMLPQAYRLNLGVSGGFEHLCGYTVAGFLLTLALSRPRSPIFIIISLAGLGVLLEVSQYWAPGREPEMDDVVMGAAGAALGALFAAWLRDTLLVDAERVKANRRCDR